MYKTKIALLIVVLVAMSFILNSTPATMQERTNTNNQNNQNNSSQNRNSNRNRNGNMNSNTNRSGDSNMVFTSMSISGAAMIGGMSREEFDRINAQGNAAVAAITPTSAALSKADQKLMMDVAMGGIMQLEVSRVAVQKATSEEARVLAQSEVEEQTGVTAKLREIASAKGMTLPMAPDSKTQSMVSKMQGMSAGMEFDRTYVRESGVKGHEKLQSVMTKVQSNAADPAMTALAAATMPVIRMHLQVSRNVVDNMSGSGKNNNGSNTNRSSNSNGSTNSNR